MKKIHMVHMDLKIKFVLFFYSMFGVLVCRSANCGQNFVISNINIIIIIILFISVQL